MAGEDLSSLFEGVSAFGWDPKKRATNLRDHKIDFADVKGIFDGYTNVRRSDRHGEVRYQIFGFLQGRPAAIICTFHGSLCWIISARLASRAERRKYYGGLTIRAEQG